MIRRVGWSFVLVALIYSLQVAIRAAALWRVMVGSDVPYSDVLRIRLSAEAVEMLTFTGPFLAEPAKGWLLKRRGLATAAAFAAVIIEYLLYMVASSLLGILALWLLVSSSMLPEDLRLAAEVLLAATAAFVGAFSSASVSGIGLIAPGLRASGILIGRRRADRAAEHFAGIEELIIQFLHGHHWRLLEVLAIEIAAQALMLLEIWVVFAALDMPRSWRSAAIIEGGVKFVGILFAFVPGQVGVSEGAYAWLAGVIGLSNSAGLSLALVRRLRGLAVAVAGVLALALLGHPQPSADRESRIHGRS